MKNIELSENELNVLIDSLAVDYYTGNTRNDFNTSIKNELLGKLMDERDK